MGEAALNMAFPVSQSPDHWPLRLAQQAFAALLEDSRRQGSFRIAALRATARAALSALSVDDRGLLERWLTLQLVSLNVGPPSACLGTLAGVEAALAAAVRMQLPRARTCLETRNTGFTVAA